MIRSKLPRLSKYTTGAGITKTVKETVKEPVTKESTLLDVHHVEDIYHVDNWLDTPVFMLPEIRNSKRFTEEKKKAITHARFKLECLRFPATKTMEFSDFIKAHNVYCSYLGKIYKLTFASRMGWIGLREDFTLNHGYDAICRPGEVDWWSDKPEVPDYYLKEQIINKAIEAKKE